MNKQKNKHSNHLNSTKGYIKDTIENAQSSKDLWKRCDKLLNCEQISVLPSHGCATALTYTFAGNYNDKIDMICISTDQLFLHLMSESKLNRNLQNTANWIPFWRGCWSALPGVNLLLYQQIYAQPFLG